MDMMKYSFKNYVLFSELIDFSKVKSSTFVDFSVLKSSDLIDFSVLSLYHAKVQPSGGLYRFSRLKSSALIGLALYHDKVLRSGGLYRFSVLKSRDSVDFSTVSLYQTKVQLPTGLWDFTLLKRYSGNVIALYYGNVVALYRGNVVTCYHGSRLKRRRPAIAPPVRCPSWAYLRRWQAGSRAGPGELGAGRKLRAGKLGLASCELEAVLNKSYVQKN